MRGWIVQLRKGLLEFCVLSALRYGESYGYEIVRRLESLEELAVTESTLYLILGRLRREGFLKVRAVPSREGPPRRYYALTALGRRRVKEMDDYWQSLCASIGKLRKGIPKGNVK